MPCLLFNSTVGVSIVLRGGKRASQDSLFPPWKTIKSYPIMRSISSRLFLSLILLAVALTLTAQREWQFGLNAQYELDIPGTRDFQMQAVSPGLFLGLKMKAAEAHAVVGMNMRWERLREDSVDFRWRIPGTQENVWQDNLVLGPGLQVVVFPEKKLQMLIGLEIFVGIPLRTKYELFGPVPSNPFVLLPSYALITGGTELLVGWQGYLGIGGALSARLGWQLRAGFGHGDQAFDWGDNGNLSGIGKFIAGRYVYLGLGTTYALPENK